MGGDGLLLLLLLLLAHRHVQHEVELQPSVDGLRLCTRERAPAAVTAILPLASHGPWLLLRLVSRPRAAAVAVAACRAWPRVRGTPSRMKPLLPCGGNSATMQLP